MHERALRVVDKDDNLTFQELLDKGGSEIIHQSNLRQLTTLMYTVKHRLSPEPILQLFTEHHNTYELRKKRQWEIPNINNVTYGKESLRYPRSTDMGTPPGRNKTIENII